MSNKGKNKLKDNLILKQLAFFVLVLLWIAALVFKHQLTGPVKWLLYAGLIILTILGLYYINRSFFGIGEKHDTHK
ncbi:hypothetical protein [Lactococcus termiticola]|uniref:Uncharacterized protein n=1 Tax=Lactococcus termiticola TaxID=2169526 RepID=A0A2R5HDW8_9LACT|nr:hypothetical protein [Lactococcus termiticola]GBG96267.1 hypothetical protein NtB2_00378 [Lactococcus termiticola]